MSGMRTIPLGPNRIPVPALSLGCMRIGGLSREDCIALLTTARECGMTFFDHADIYGRGRSEEVFADAAAELGWSRSDYWLQSKCGIRQGYFDFSRAHILDAVEGSLRRLRTDYLDVLLLHRPDVLMEPEEVATAFDELHASGKVRHFGVSNQNPAQMELLRRASRQPLVANQLQLSIAHCPPIDHALNVNMNHAAAVDRDGGVLEYGQLHGITPQAWSPLQFGFFQGVFIDHPEFVELNRALQALAATHGVTAAAIAIAWLLRHPSRMQVILGTTRPERIRELARAPEVTLTREAWYTLYCAAGKRLP